MNCIFSKERASNLIFKARFIKTQTVLYFIYNLAITLVRSFFFEIFINSIRSFI